MNRLWKGAFAFAFVLVAAGRVDAAIIDGDLISPPWTPINLSDEGSIDWIHWGLSNATSVNRKRNGGSKISNFTLIKAGSQVVRFNDSASRYYWTDGAPTLNASNSAAGVYINNYDGPGRGFEFTVPADLELQTLRVYVGTFQASAQLQAILSDNSDQPFVQTLVGRSDRTVQGVFQIHFAAASPGQTLKIRWTETADLGVADNITLQAAILCEIPAVPEPAGILAFAVIGVVALSRRRKIN